MVHVRELVNPTFLLLIKRSKGLSRAKYHASHILIIIYCSLNSSRQLQGLELIYKTTASHILFDKTVLGIKGYTKKKSATQGCFIWLRSPEPPPPPSSPILLKKEISHMLMHQAQLFTVMFSLPSYIPPQQPSSTEFPLLSSYPN